MNQENDKREVVSSLNLTTDYSNLWQKADAFQKECSDYMVSKPNLHSNFGVDMRYSFKSDNGTVNKHGMSDHAFSQLCAKIGVPVRYMKKCLEEGDVDLVSDNINSWLERYNKPLFIRSYQDRVRGVLSSKFSVLDTPDILEVLADTAKDFKVKGFFMNEERFHARVIEKNMLSVQGEDLYAGLQIDSSDVGRSILIVRFLIFKQVCTNGLTISKGDGVLFEQKHIGISSDDFRKGLKENLDRVPDLVAKAVDAIKRSKSEKITSEWITSQIEHMREALSLTEEAGNKVISLVDERYGRSKWGVINSITEVAQDYTLERRIDIEDYAGKLLVA